MPVPWRATLVRGTSVFFIIFHTLESSFAKHSSFHLYFTMDILQYYSEGNKKFRFSTFVEDLKEDIAAHSLEIDVAGDNDWKALKEAWSSILKRFKTQNADVEVSS